MKSKKIILKTLSIIGILALIFLSLRFVSPRYLDDISPRIDCEDELISKSDILFVIPNYEGEGIGNNKEWCQKILSYNKTLALHGIYHTYREFQMNITKEQLEMAIEEFKECFGKSPELFKPPQLEISEENIKLVKENGMKVKAKFAQISHKSYHCSDTGRYSNSLQKWI